MGTWDSGITQDDAVADVVAFVTDRLKASDSLQSATAQARARFAELERDDDEAPLLWLALAHVQWKYGAVDPELLSRVRSDVAAERGLRRWLDDPGGLGARKAALARFLNRVEQPNPKPSALPRTVVRKAPFRRGDCLSVRLPDGRHTAALVLREDDTNPENGMNLVASLDYCELEPPTIATFERREWLVLSHGNWNGERDICWYLPVRFQQERKRITLAGNVPPLDSDPRDAPGHVAWSHLGVQILLCRAHLRR